MRTFKLSYLLIKLSVWREQVNFQWDDEVRFVLDQYAELDFYSASSLKQQSVGRQAAPLTNFIVFGLTSDLPHSRRAQQSLTHSITISWKLYKKILSAPKPVYQWRIFFLKWQMYHVWTTILRLDKLWDIDYCDEKK
jgi:hypothetical protein